MAPLDNAVAFAFEVGDLRGYVLEPTFSGMDDDLEGLVFVPRGLDPGFPHRSGPVLRPDSRKGIDDEDDRQGRRTRLRQRDEEKDPSAKDHDRYDSEES